MRGNSLERISSTQVRCNLVVEWPRVARRKARDAKSNHETSRISGSPEEADWWQWDPAQQFVWLVLEDPQGSCAPLCDGFSLFTFQYLRCLAVQPLTPGFPPIWWVMAPCDILPGISTQGQRFLDARQGPLAQVVRAHG